MKLKLDHVEVRSFVTSLAAGYQKHLLGGLSHGPLCSEVYGCGTVETAHTCPYTDGPSQPPCDSVQGGCPTAFQNCNGNTNRPCTGAASHCGC